MFYDAVKVYCMFVNAAGQQGYISWGRVVGMTGSALNMIKYVVNGWWYLCYIPVTLFVLTLEPRGTQKPSSKWEFLGYGLPYKQLKNNSRAQ